jgi:hypothetical protein
MKEHQGSLFFLQNYFFSPRLLDCNLILNQNNFNTFNQMKNKYFTALMLAFFG